MNKKLYSKETQNALLNFDISGYKMPQIFIISIIQIKKAAAQVTHKLNVLDKNMSSAIIKACDFLLKHFDSSQFPLDVFQTGSGTSTNMNVNEVIATLASSYSKSKEKIHPNNDVNWGQSSNCVIPSAINMSNRVLVNNLLTEIDLLINSFQKIMVDNVHSFKIGRTHLQDAVPMTIAQEFGAFQQLIIESKNRLNNFMKELEFIPIGGTAIGTGITSHPQFAKMTCTLLSKALKIKFQPSKNKFADISTRDTQVMLMGILSSFATSLIKITNDLRLLSSGPQTGLGEITFKELQAGSSIMPGKVNPVIAEMMIQVCAFIIGKNTSIIIAGQNGPLQLNMMMPLIAHETIESLRLLTNAIRVFRIKGVDNIIVNKRKASEWIDKSFALITPLKNHPKIGYDIAVQWVKEAQKQDISIQQLVKSKKVLSEKEIQKIFDVQNMVGNINESLKGK